MNKKDAKRELERQKQVIKDDNICGHIKQNGKPCKQRAGHGTIHLGEGKCRTHSPPSHEVSRLKGEVKDLATPVVVSPGQAMAGVLHLSAGQLLYASAKVMQLTEDEVMSEIGIHPWIRFQRSLMNDTAKFAKIAADAGIDERLVNLAEQQTQMVAKLIEAVADDLDLTEEQRAKLGPSVRARLQLQETN